MPDAKTIRRQISTGEWRGTTVGRAGRYVQTGLVILRQAEAYDFLVFCQRNPQPCPLLEVTDPGCPTPQTLAPGADIRHAVGLYSVWRDGELVEEVTDIAPLWQDDFVAFFLGSSLTFLQALADAGCVSSVGVVLYKTNIMCKPAGAFCRADGSDHANLAGGKGGARRAGDFAIPGHARGPDTHW